MHRVADFSAVCLPLLSLGLARPACCFRYHSMSTAMNLGRRPTIVSGPPAFCSIACGLLQRVPDDDAQFDEDDDKMDDAEVCHAANDIACLTVPGYIESDAARVCVGGR